MALLRARPSEDDVQSGRILRARLSEDASFGTAVGSSAVASTSGGTGNVEKAALTTTPTQAIGEVAVERLPIATVVKIFATGIAPSYLMPWQVLQQSKWTGTGFVLDGKRIMTNAHVVQNASVLQVQRQGGPKKYRARATVVAHDLDLALVEVSDEAFWTGLPPAVFANDLPEMFAEIKAVGFPQGGSTVCVTKGVVSRIDAQLYVHSSACGVVPESQNSPGNLLLLQIDAAINLGNSGGPTFDAEGKVVGVASSGMSKAQNVGYIIPVRVVNLFLGEVARTGSWSAISELGLTVRSLELDGLRSYLQMAPEMTGMLVDRIAPMGALHGVVLPGDVITQIDGYEVSNECKVPLEVSGQTIFVPADSLITGKAKGMETKFKVLRDGQLVEKMAVCKPIPPLMARFHGNDCLPEYLLVGGLIFTKLTVPLKHEYSGAVHSRTYGDVIFRSAVWDAGLKVYKAGAEHEVVILLRILEHDLNIGCPGGVRILATVNGEPIKNLRDTARLVAGVLKSEERFLRFRFKRDNDVEGSIVPDVVLEREKVRAADKEICQKNRIAAFASEGLLGYFAEAALDATPTAGVDGA
eukprot:TRINITY_DN36283_c0_g1_i1.p1 TRINITY_DN36283_c0_g1~~TRINITY_DN36283_c0_g1_i1.p1  ORF type:complete len:583 (-),score=149.04 TRINITY_DN36283_c0_g1_i1:220-1968(-)